MAADQNATTPDPGSPGSALRAFSLDDALTARNGRVLISGTQALVRLALTQARLDRERGLSTAGFVTGYRGSPLAGLDLALWRARSLLDAGGVRFLPAINEELAAAAALGSQRVATDPGRTRDGVFALWYGKGPGLDRAGDTMRHGNAYGASATGGVLAVVGDDHGCVSSGMPFQSDRAFIAWSMPVLHPATLGEMIEFGLYGWALSRASGAWVGLKAISETVESTATVDLDAIRTVFVAPAGPFPPPGGLHFRLQDLPSPGIEERLAAKLDAARAFAHANPIDKLVVAPPDARIGIVTCGKAHLDVMEALRRLEIAPESLAAAGVRLLKIGQVFPLDPIGLRSFATGLSEILVVEEKAPIVEEQIRSLLYDADARPRVLGKTDGRGGPLLAATGETRPSRVMPVLADWLARHAGALDRRARVPVFAPTPALVNEADGVRRTPWFCAGCPHNLSTRVPDGSQASGGIGCHGMSGWMKRENSFSQVPMGNEGIDWVGQSFHTRATHRFQNMGDGTYSHSGYLAIRQAVASGANLTYKILYNDAVAMTGGQPVEGRLSVPQIARQLEAAGVQRIAVLAPDPSRWRARAGEFPPGTRIASREELDDVQRALRDTPGVSALLYDQVCATEERRRIRRGLVRPHETRAFIHPDVCENCGDCTARSNCVAIHPIDTPLGRKRRIDPSACNDDLACLPADCPAIVTIEGATPRRWAVDPSHAASIERAVASLSAPPAWRWTGPYDLLVAGVGGTGIVTLGALVVTAAHLEGLAASVLDFTGMAQKGGSVIAYVRLAADPALLHQTRIDTQQADAMLACDLVVGASPPALETMTRGRTRVVANLHEVATSAFVSDPDADVHAGALLAKIRHAIGSDAVHSCDAHALAARFLGGTITANVLLLGAAWQAGLVPVGLAAIGRVLELNGVDVAENRLAFAIGRLAIADPSALDALDGVRAAGRGGDDVDQRIAAGRARLAAWQDETCARDYVEQVERVRSAERARLGPDATLELTRAFATQYARLVAVKDEYEVARLYTDGSLERALADDYEGRIAIRYHFAPERFVRRGADGRPARKIALGGWARPLLRVLAAAKVLRGTPLDPFAGPAERRAERSLADDYARAVLAGAGAPDAAGVARALRIANLPASMRGYGRLRRESAAALRAALARETGATPSTAGAGQT
ncbi:MAG: indolepyruvate ferredoxin oxidoreductase family protein [Burkholderiales bacterium]